MSGRQSSAMQHALALHAKIRNISEAARLAGVAPRSLRRALRALGVQPAHAGRPINLY